MTGLSKLSKHASSVINTPILGAVDFGERSSAGNEYCGVYRGMISRWPFQISTPHCPSQVKSMPWDGSETMGPALYTCGVNDTTSLLATYAYSPDVHVTPGDR
jgi:hypothetical protein